jgi:hypothetical protein
MTTKTHYLAKPLLAMSLLMLSVCMSCNNNGGDDKKDASTSKDTAAPAAMDTSKKMSMDTTKKDTSGRGSGQVLPPPK